MAKKKTTKKHKFKYVEPNISASTNSADISAQGRPVIPAVVSVDNGRTIAVGYDLRRVGILAVSLIALEFLIWILFGHTGLGNTVYNFVHL